MKEQEHRRSHQENSPREYSISSERHRNPRSDSRNSFKSHSPRRISSKLIGQIFGLIYNLALLYLIYDLANSGSDQLALGIFVTNALLIIFAAISARRLAKFKPNHHYRDGRNNRSPRPSRPSQSAAR